MSEYFSTESCFKIADIAVRLVQASRTGSSSSLQFVLEEFDKAFEHVSEKMQDECSK